MSDKPCWLEDWEYLPAQAGTPQGAIARTLGKNHASILFEPTGDELLEEGRLAVAAPALVRALLLAEWAVVEWDEGSVGPQCQGCGFQSSIAKHDAGCVVDAALTIAGFPDQTSRDAARKAMEAK
jgi:hypothetical protein